MNLELEQQLIDEGYTHLYDFGGTKGICGLRRFMFTTGLVYGLDDQGFSGRWCFPNNSDAQFSIIEWTRLHKTGESVPDNPENDFWIKHKGVYEYSNFRREDFNAELSKHEADFAFIHK